MSEKNKAVKIEFPFKEGSNNPLRGAPCAPFTIEGWPVWKIANTVLQLWAREAPTAGNGVNKVDFIVTYEDGITYEGTLGLQNCNVHDRRILENHIKGINMFYAGRAKPAHLSQEQYETFIGYDPESRAAAQRFMDCYEIGFETPTK